MKGLLLILPAAIFFSCEPTESEKRIKRQEKIRAEIKEIRIAIEHSADNEIKIINAFKSDTTGMAAAIAPYEIEQDKLMAKMETLLAESDSLSKIRSQ